VERRLTRSVTLQNGAIVIVGSSLSDTVDVSPSGSSYIVTENGTKTAFAASSVTRGEVRFYGNNGNDFFTTGSSLNADRPSSRGKQP
jgi:hypothetical protein